MLDDSDSGSTLKGSCTGSWLMKEVYMDVPVSPTFRHPEFRTGKVTLEYDKKTDTLTTEDGKRIFLKQGLGEHCK